MQVEADSMGALVRLALKVRPHFHRYLVRWFSGKDSHKGLLGLSRLFNHMRRYFKQGPLHELFLAADAVVDTLLAVPDGTALALARMERERLEAGDAQRVRDRRPRVLVVDDSETVRRLAAGVDRFVAKPFAQDELLAQIDALLHPIGG
jgi:hypothetical protein